MLISFCFCLIFLWIIDRTYITYLTYLLIVFWTLFIGFRILINLIDDILVPIPVLAINELDMRKHFKENFSKIVDLTHWITLDFYMLQILQLFKAWELLKAVDLIVI